MGQGCGVMGSPLRCGDVCLGLRSQEITVTAEKSIMKRTERTLLEERKTVDKTVYSSPQVLPEFSSCSWRQRVSAENAGSVKADLRPLAHSETPQAMPLPLGRHPGAV